MKRWTLVWSTAVVLSLGGGMASGQSFEERLERVRQQREQERAARAAAATAAVTEAGVAQEPSIPQKMRTMLRQVELEEVTAREAFQWWSRTTGIPLVMDWTALELAGVLPDARVSLKLDHVPAEQMLHLLIKQVAPDVPMIYESTPWYVQVMTKEQANQITVTRIYEINDLLVRVPDFKGPEFDLENALDTNRQSGGRGSSGGGGGGRSGGLFSDDDKDDKEVVLTKTERGEQIATLIRDTIEPETWDVYGGRSTIRYFEGKLVVNAPMYVHRQIGLPMPSRHNRTAAPAGNSVREPARTPSGRRTVPPPRGRNYNPARAPGVSGVQQ